MPGHRAITLNLDLGVKEYSQQIAHPLLKDGTSGMDREELQQQENIVRAENVP